MHIMECKQRTASWRSCLTKRRMAKQKLIFSLSHCVWFGSCYQVVQGPCDTCVCFGRGLIWPVFIFIETLARQLDLEVCFLWTGCPHLLAISLVNVTRWRMTTSGCRDLVAADVYLTRWGTPGNTVYIGSTFHRSLPFKGFFYFRLSYFEFSITNIGLFTKLFARPNMSYVWFVSISQNFDL